MLFFLALLSSVGLFVYIRRALAHEVAGTRQEEPGPGIWLKEFLAMLMIKAGSRRRPPFDPTESEKLQPETLNPRVEDEVEFTDNHYFLARDMDNKYMIWVRLGWRPVGVETTVFVFAPEAGATGQLRLYSEPQPFGTLPNRITQAALLPRTALSPSHDPFVQHSGGLSMQCLAPLGDWAIKFDGNLHSETSTNIPVKLELRWAPTTQAVVFDQAQDPTVTAKFLAQPAWSRVFFESLRTLHQRRYEQGGVITGSLELSVHGAAVPLSLHGIRARTYGPRRWADFQRWIYHIVAFEDGSYFTLTVIRRQHWPLFMIGFLYGSDTTAPTPVIAAPSLVAVGEEPQQHYSLPIVLKGMGRYVLEVSIDREKTSIWEFATVKGGAAILLEGGASFVLRRQGGDHQDSRRGFGLAEWGCRKGDEKIPRWWRDK